MAFSYYVSLWGNYSCAMGQRLVALRTSSIILTSQFQKTFHLLKHKMKRLSDFTLNFHFHALEKEMATHSSVLAWRIPGTGEPGGLPSMGLHRVGHDWSNLVAVAAAANWKKSILWHVRGFADSSVDTESTCHAGDLGSVPGLGRSPGGRKGYPPQYSGLENSWTM